MEKRTNAMIEALRAEQIETWFDLGLMLDRLREERAAPGRVAPLEFDDSPSGAPSHVLPNVLSGGRKRGVRQ